MFDVEIGRDKITAQTAQYIVGERDGDPFIICIKCGVRSYNPSDVANLYCVNCHVFHED